MKALDHPIPNNEQRLVNGNPAPGSAELFLDDARARACIHCGLCLGSCPTYLETGNENDSPRGRIYLMRAVQEGRLPLDASPVRHIDLCLGCRACEAACPSGVQYGHLLEHTRAHVESRFRRSLFQRFYRRAIEHVLPYPGRLKLALLPARALQRLRAQSLLPAFAREAMDLLPDVEVDEHPADAESRDKQDACVAPSGKRVAMLSGCVMSVMFERTNAATARLLKRLGYQVVQPSGQGCCGALFSHTGNLASALDCARRNIAAFEGERPDWILTNAAGCGSAMKEYGSLLAQDPAWAERARQFSLKTRDFTELLAENIPALIDARAAKSAAKVTYHDACHLAHAQRITQPPRALVKAIAGVNYVELPEADVCCGSAGTYNLTEPEMARRLQQRKIENIIKSGAQVVVTSNPGCLLQIQAGLRRAGAKVRILHLADFLDQHAAR